MCYNSTCTQLNYDPSAGPSTHLRFASQPVPNSLTEWYRNRDYHPAPEDAVAVVVFRGLRIGVFHDW